MSALTSEALIRAAIALVHPVVTALWLCRCTLQPSSAKMSLMQGSCSMTITHESGTKGCLQVPSLISLEQAAPEGVALPVPSHWYCLLGKTLRVKSAGPVTAVGEAGVVVDGGSDAHTPYGRAHRLRLPHPRL